MAGLDQISGIPRVPQRPICRRLDRNGLLLSGPPYTGQPRKTRLLREPGFPGLIRTAKSDIIEQ